MLPLGSVGFLQPQLGEDAYHHHDGHHPTNDVDDEVGLVPGGIVGEVGGAAGGLALAHPLRLVVVGARFLVQAALLVLAAIAEATSAAAEGILPEAAVERRIPLPHHVEVAPAFLRGRRRLRHVRWLHEPALVAPGEHDDAA